MEIDAVRLARDYRTAILAAFELATRVGDAIEAGSLVDQVRPILKHRLEDLHAELDPPQTFATVWALQTLLTLDRLKTAAVREPSLREWHELADEALNCMRLMRKIETEAPRAEPQAGRAAASDT